MPRGALVIDHRAEKITDLLVVVFPEMKSIMVVELGEQFRGDQLMLEIKLRIPFGYGPIELIRAQVMSRRIHIRFDHEHGEYDHMLGYLRDVFNELKCVRHDFVHRCQILSVKSHKA